jgi:voltage-gated potassium channel Kch
MIKKRKDNCCTALDDFRERLGEIFLGHIPQGYTFRQKFALVLSVSLLGYIWGVLQMVGTVISCAGYVYQTYNQYNFPFVFEEFFAVFFTVDLLAKWYASNDRIYFWVASIYPAIDIITVVPTYVLWIGNFEGSSLSIIRFLKLLRIIRITRAFTLVKQFISGLEKRLMVFSLTLFTMIFLTAGLLNLIEYQLDPSVAAELGNDAMTFGNAMYMLIVTVSTVGYGDVTAVTTWGRFIVCIFIIASLVMVPIQISALQDELSLRSKYRSPFTQRREAPHIVVVGFKNSSAAMREFLAEMYHPDRLSGLPDRLSSRRCVVLSPDEPEEDIKTIIANPYYEGKIQYVRGSVMNNADLAKASVYNAAAAFIISDPAANDVDAEDKFTALRTLMIKVFNPKIRCFVQVSKASSLSKMDSINDIFEAVCLDEWKVRLIAQSAIFPGYATLVQNFFRAVLPPNAYAAKQLPVWLREYGEGAGQELYCVSLPSCFDGLSFSDAASVIYEVSDGKIILLGCREADIPVESPLYRTRIRELRDLKNHGSALFSSLADPLSTLRTFGFVRGRVLMNPGPQYRLDAQPIVYIIAEDEAAASFISVSATYANVKFPPPLSKLGRDMNSAYAGYPLKYNSENWTWGKNAKLAYSFSLWFHDYEPLGRPSLLETMKADMKSHSGLQEAKAQSATQVVMQNGHINVVPLARSNSIAFAKQLWAHLKDHIWRKIFKRIGLRYNRLSLVPTKSRRFSKHVIPNAITSAASDILSKNAEAHSMHREKTNGISDPGATNESRGKVLKSLIVTDIRKDLPLISSTHILVVGSLSAFGGFLPCLRSPHTLGTSLDRHVTLLTTYDESESASRALEDAMLYGNVSIVIGSLSSADDLNRAGIEAASCLVLLHQPPSSDDRPISMNLDDDRERADAETIFSYLTLETLLDGMITQPSFYVVVELSSIGNLQVLNSKRLSKLRVDAMILKSIDSLSTKGRNRTIGRRKPIRSKFAGNAISPRQMKNGEATSVTESASPQATVNRTMVVDINYEGVDNDTSIETGSPTVSDDLFPVPPHASKRAGHYTASPGLIDSSEKISYMPASKRGGCCDSILTPKMSNDEVFSSPFFTAGYGVASDTLHTILVQSWYDREVVRFAEELVSPNPDQCSRLIQEPVPARFHGKQFSELFFEMLHKYGVIVLGLYRSKVVHNAPLPYVFTAPPPDTLLFSTPADEDLMWVLSPRPLFSGPFALAPEELLGPSVGDVGTGKPRAPVRGDRPSILPPGFAPPHSENSRIRSLSSPNSIEHSKLVSSRLTGKAFMQSLKRVNVTADAILGQNSYASDDLSMSSSKRSSISKRYSNSIRRFDSGHFSASVPSGPPSIELAPIRGSSTPLVATPAPIPLMPPSSTTIV